MRACLAIALLVSCLTIVPRAAHACSTVFFDKNGQTRIGHNMDWFADRLVLVTNKRHVKKHGFIPENSLVLLAVLRRQRSKAATCNPH